MYAVLDIEATGGKVGEEAIIEIAIYKYDGKNTVDQFITLVKPPKSIDQYVQKLTGITNKMVATAPKFHEIAKRIVEITEDCILVGHNVEFDYRMLRQEFNRLAFKYEKKWIDTFDYSEKLIPGMESYSLGKLAKALGIPVTDRHRASGDARATLKLFQILKDKDTDKTIIAKSAVMVPKNLQNKLEKLVENLPNEIGNFYMFNGKDELVYIGESINIAQQVRQLLTGNGFFSAQLRKYTRRVDFEISGNQMIAKIKRIQEIIEIQPKLNLNNMKQNRFAFGLYRSLNLKGTIRLEIGKIRKNQLPILGFETKNQALEALQSITRLYELSPVINKLVEDEAAGEKKKLDTHFIKNYNDKVNQFLDKFHPGKTYLLLDKGRETNEKSFVLVQNGQVTGFGYYQYFHQINTLERILNVMTKVENNVIILLILNNYIYAHPSVEIKFLD